MNRPVLWLDHGGWPAHQSEDWLPQSIVLSDTADIFLIPADSIQ